MTVQLSVQFDKAQFKEIMSSWRDQYNYALKTAMNDTVVDAQSAIRTKMHSEFIIRNKYAG